MPNFSPDEFEQILHDVKENVSSVVECDEIRAIESNFNTKGMFFKSKINPKKDGIIIVGEDNGAIAADISSHDGLVRSVIMKDEKDKDGIKNIVGWVSQNYS